MVGEFYNKNGEGTVIEEEEEEEIFSDYHNDRLTSNNGIGKLYLLKVWISYTREASREWDADKLKNDVMVHIDATRLLGDNE